MNKYWIHWNLQEAQEEIARILRDLEASADYDETEFRIAMEHAYDHLNTAWNSRNEDHEHIANHTEEQFYRWRAFPIDISMGKPE